MLSRFTRFLGSGRFAQPETRACSLTEPNARPELVLLRRGRPSFGKLGGGAGAITRLMVIGLTACVLSGCVPALVGGAVVGTTVVATDRRTAGMQLDDQAIELRVRNLVANNYSDAVQVTPSSYNGNVLLVGTVPDVGTSSQIEKLVQQLEHVKRVINQLQVGAPRTVAEGAADSWISGQVRAAFLATEGLPSNAFAVTTNRGVVYLQGLVTREEGDRGANVAAGIKGVNKVVKLFEYISPEEASKTLQLGGSENTVSAENGATPATGASRTQPSSSTQSDNDASMPPSGALAIPVPSAP